MSRSCGAGTFSCGSEAARKFFCNLVMVNHALIQIQSSILIWFVSITWCIDWITWQGICQDVSHTHTHTHTHTHRKRQPERERILPHRWVSSQEGVISPPSLLLLHQSLFTSALGLFAQTLALHQKRRPSDSFQHHLGGANTEGP